MRVAGVQRHGAVGERLVKRVLRRQHGRVPSIFAPALGQQPSLGTAFGETLHALNAISLVFSPRKFVASGEEYTAEWKKCTCES